MIPLSTTHYLLEVNGFGVERFPHLELSGLRHIAQEDEPSRARCIRRGVRGDDGFKVAVRVKMVRLIDDNLGVSEEEVRVQNVVLLETQHIIILLECLLCFSPYAYVCVALTSAKGKAECSSAASPSS